MQIAQGDLRKAQIHIDFYSDLADKGAHVYFGTRDVLCRGLQKPLDYNERIWVSENQCQVMTSCEKHAELAAHFACADTLNDTNVVNEFAGIATFQLVGKIDPFLISNGHKRFLCNQALERVFSNAPW